MRAVLLKRPSHANSQATSTPTSPFSFQKKLGYFIIALKTFAQLVLVASQKFFFTVVSSAFYVMHILHGTNIITASFTSPPFLFNEFKASATLTHLSITIGFMVR